METKNIILELRTKQGLSQEDLAEKTDLSVNYIGMLERGEKIPSLETFIDIVNVLGVSADMILADVVDTGYTVRSSLLTEQLEKLSPEERKRIYDVVDTLIRHAEEK